MSEFHIKIYEALSHTSEEVLHYYLLHLDTEAKNVLVRYASEDKEISAQRFNFICDMAKTPRHEHLEMVITRAQIFRYSLNDNWFKPLLPFNQEEWLYLCHEYPTGLLNGFIPADYFEQITDIAVWNKKIDEWNIIELLSAAIPLKHHLLTTVPVKMSRHFTYEQWNSFLDDLVLPNILKDWYLHVHTPERISLLYLERNCPSLLFLEMWATWKDKVGHSARYKQQLSRDLESHVRIISQHIDIFATPIDGDLKECRILL